MSKHIFRYTRVEKLLEKINWRYFTNFRANINSIEPSYFHKSTVSSNTIMNSTLFATSLFAIATGFGNFLPNMIRRGDINRSFSGRSSSSRPTARGPSWLARVASKTTSSEDKSVVNTGTCSQPCQRVPHLIKFQHALIMNGVGFEIGSVMTAKNVDENGFIDVGRCVGSCRKVESGLIRVS